MIDFSKPVKTASGLAVTIYTTTTTGRFPVHGVIYLGTDDILSRWNSDGLDQYGRKGYNLVNIPEEICRMTHKEKALSLLANIEWPWKNIDGEEDNNVCCSCERFEKQGHNKDCSLYMHIEKLRQHILENWKEECFWCGTKPID